MIQTARAKEITAWIDSHPDYKTSEFAKVEIAGEIVALDVLKFPIKLLIYNIRNGRFAAQLIAKERELKRKLEPNDSEDSLTIRQLLLELDESETKNLLDHIRKHGQLDPGMITYDGAVINGNRRMAILLKLKEDTGDPKYEYLKVGRLPKSIGEKDLWRIEAGIQFAKDFKLEYGPVNELLKLREGQKQGLTPKEISAALLGRFSEKQVIEKLEILKQIDSYLEFIGKPQQYDEVERDVEKFNSLVNYVVHPLKRRGVSTKDLTDINVVAFNLIKSDDVTHWDIRKLREVTGTEKAKEEIYRVYNPKAPKKTSVSELVDAFRTALEIVEDKKAEEKPEKLLRKALEAVRAINPKSPKLRESGVEELLKKLRSEVEQLIKHAKV